MTKNFGERSITFLTFFSLWSFFATTLSLNWLKHQTNSLKMIDTYRIDKRRSDQSKLCLYEQGLICNSNPNLYSHKLWKGKKIICFHQIRLSPVKVDTAQHTVSTQIECRRSIKIEEFFALHYCHFKHISIYRYYIH